MKIEYHIINNESYYVEGFKRYRSSFSKVFRYSAIVIKVLGLLLLSFGAWVSFNNADYLIGAVCIAAVLVIIFSTKIDHYILRRNIKKSPYRNDDLVLTFTGDGLHTKSEMIDMKLSWSAFTKVKAVKGGFLLFQGPKFYNWLPDENISDETQLTSVKELLEKNVQLRL